MLDVAVLNYNHSLNVPHSFNASLSQLHRKTAWANYTGKPREQSWVTHTGEPCDEIYFSIQTHDREAWTELARIFMKPNTCTLLRYVDAFGIPVYYTVLRMRDM